MSYEEKKTTLPTFAEDKNVYLEIQRTQPNTCRNQQWLVTVNRDLTSLLISVWVDPRAGEGAQCGRGCLHACVRVPEKPDRRTESDTTSRGTEQVRLSAGASEPGYGTLSISSVSAFVK